MKVRGDERGIRTTEVVFDIIETIKRQNGARLVDITDEVDRSKSTIYTHLVSLVNLGYVRNDEGTYQLDLPFLDLGTYTRTTYDIFPTAKPKLNRLAAVTNERVQLMVESNGRGVYLYRAEGRRAIPAEVRPGTPRFLHLSSAGKAILAHLSRDRVDEIVDQWGLPTKTNHTVVDREILSAELEDIRHNGYAINRQESIQGAWSVGVAINRDNEVLGALSLSAPIHRVRDGDQVRDDVLQAVLATADEIEIETNLAGEDGQSHRTH